MHDVKVRLYRDGALVNGIGADKDAGGATAAVGRAIVGKMTVGRG